MTHDAERLPDAIAHVIVKPTHINNINITAHMDAICFVIRFSSSIYRQN
jgi:hypothetical protein